MSHQQVTCLTILDVSVAFDTTDHSILLEHVSSWFGISSTVLSWIKSFLLTVLSISILKTTLSVFQLLKEFLKDLSLVLYSLSYTPLLSVL